jgi:hypothetical protein
MRMRHAFLYNLRGGNQWKGASEKMRTWTKGDTPDHREHRAAMAVAPAA